MAKMKLRMICRDKENLITEIIEANRAYFFRSDYSYTNAIRCAIIRNVLDAGGSYTMETTTLPED